MRSTITQQNILPRHRIKKRVQLLLEHYFKLHSNTVSKILDAYFDPSFLPRWYFFSNSVQDIANHVYITTQLLNAKTSTIKQAGYDGYSFTYFQNIGHHTPDTLLNILRENQKLDLITMDAIKTKSGIFLVIIEQQGGSIQKIIPQEDKDYVRTIIQNFGKERAYSFTEDFLQSLSSSYLFEESYGDIPRTAIISSKNHRSLRHLEMYEEVRRNNKLIVHIEETREVDYNITPEIETRISIGLPSFDNTTIYTIFSYFAHNRIQLTRSYFDSFLLPEASTSVLIPQSETRVGILSLYSTDFANTDAITNDMLSIPILHRLNANNRPINKTSNSSYTSVQSLLQTEAELANILRNISDTQVSTEDAEELLAQLESLVQTNLDISSPDEIGLFALNAISDLYVALQHLGIKSTRIIRKLLQFESINEFWTEQHKDNTKENIQGYRIIHNTERGYGKGGLRIDQIVNFTEVTALAFMMTWKCARCKIPYGGGKGGLTTNPHEFNNTHDYFETLSNFGRNLFLHTGPLKDVPAGDVGCGAQEIDIIFSGFVSLLRDLATQVYGYKENASFLGNQVISMEKARRILSRHFGIDTQNSKFLEALNTSEHYLRLVTAAQITGKPFFGIEARTGATGLGLCYTLLAGIGHKYKLGEWNTAESLTTQEEDILTKIITLNETSLINANNNTDQVISDEEWKLLTSSTYKKMLTHKTVVIQGFGKVGSSALQNLLPYGIQLIGLIDKDGAIMGDNIDPVQVSHSLQQTGSVMNTKESVHTYIAKSENPNQVLEVECDILILAALEQTLTAKNAPNIKAKIVLCGANGPNTSKAEQILIGNNSMVMYDFLANSAGVSASYFEWLRNLTERYRYESEEILKISFSIEVMQPYLMPEFSNRLKRILMQEESKSTTKEWNSILRDILFVAVNEDSTLAHKEAISLKTAGFVSAILRVLTAMLLHAPKAQRNQYWSELPSATKTQLRQYFAHPESRLYNSYIDEVVQELYKEDSA